MHNAHRTPWSYFFFFFVRIIMYFGFPNMFLLASFDRQKMFSSLLFIVLRFICKSFNMTIKNGFYSPAVQRTLPGKMTKVEIEQYGIIMELKKWR